MKYIRTEDGIWLFGGAHHKGDVIIGKKQEIDFGYCFDKKDIINQADTIEELIQIGDIVFYWSPSDDKEHCVLITCDTEICAIRGSVITKLLLPMKEDYKCVAKSYSSFNLIRDRKYLVSKGELKLL